MLPFAKLLEFGNTIERWYSGTELVVYDSNRFNPAGFIDYVGNSMRVGNVVFQNSGISPTAGTGSPFGLGINLQTGYISTLKSSALGVFINSWCMDYWVCQNMATTGGVAYCPLIFVNTNISNQEFNTRFEIDHFSTTNVYQNSSGPSYIGSISSTPLLSTTFYHYAIQYLNGRLYFFKNGILIEDFTFNITGTTWQDLAIIGNLGRGNPSTSRAIIDRYRLRTGQYFDVAGFDPSTIYPGIQIS